MKHSNSVDDWLAAARDDLSERTPDLLAEHRLIARVREMRALQSIAETRIQSLPRRERRAPWWRFSRLVPALAAAATLAIIVGIVLLAPDGVSRGPVRAPFFALVASDAIAAERSALVVPSQISGAALADYGLPVDPARIDQPIDAEFLLSPAGVVLAVRFIE